MLACRENEFQCLDGRGCINFRSLCDGRPDCFDLSDETNCGESNLHNVLKLQTPWTLNKYHEYLDSDW